MSSSLAIVEKRPSPFPGGGCAGGVLFHLLDWHRRLARKRRLFSPRRLLPSSLRSSPRRLPCPPPAPPPPAAPHPAASAADGVSPGVVARLMGLESWPATAAPPRPQKQRKVEASRPDDGDSAVVLVLPTSRSRRPHAPAPTTARSHHGADLPARSPRRTRLVHAAAAKLLEPGARARLALAYACSSPQHRKDGHSCASLQGSGMADDFLSRSESLLTPSTRVQVQPHVLPPEADCDGAAVSRRHEQRSINNANVEMSATTVVLPRMDFTEGNISKRSFAMDAKHKESRVRDEVMRTCARVRSSGAAVQTGAERLRKRATPTRPDVSGSVSSGSLADSLRPVGRARELVSGSRRVAQSGSGPRREFMGSIAGQGSTTGRDVINRSGLASTSRISSNGSVPKRGSRKAGCGTVASNREDRNAVAFASRSSTKPVARASSRSNVLKSGCPSRLSHDTTHNRMPPPDTKYMEASPSVMATSEKDEFSRLLKAKINELGLSDRIEFTSSEKPSGKLTAPVLQELISALTNDMNTSISQSSNYSDAAVPLSCNGNIDCIDPSSYMFSNDQSPDFQKCYQSEQDVDSSATSLNNEPNQPSPTSVLEASFSNDASSLGSPVEKNEGKDLFVSTENKMEDLFNLESDIVNLAMSIDTRKTDAEETLYDNDKLSCSQNFLPHDSKFLESRLCSTEKAISNVELLLGNSLHPFIMEMLENTMDKFGGGEYSDLTEDKKYQHTNFLVDCIVESLDSKFCNFGKCGYKAWLKLSLSLSRDLLKCQVLEDISDWRESSGTALRQVSDKEVDQVTARWDSNQAEAFDISIAIEKDILEALVGEFALDLW